MNIKILTPDDLQWDTYFHSLPLNRQDPFFTPEYYALEKKDAECFIYEEGENFLFYPYIKTHINTLGYELDQDYYDIQGAYGYNGALVQDESQKEFIHRARAAFREYAHKQNIVAEFIRFNPLYENQNYFDDIEPILANQNIIVDLKTEDIWMNSYEHSTRKNVKKAIRNDLGYKIFTPKEITQNDLQSFVDVYRATMVRNNAQDEYFFTLEYFNEIKNSLENNALFIFIYKDGTVISVELILLNSYTAYSFLGGTLQEYFAYRPNDYLKHILIETLQKKGLHHFILGGGVSIDDGIFKYKRNFAKNGVYDFYIGKSLYNESVYNAILKQWGEKTDLQTQEQYKRYLLKYQYGV